MSKRGLMLAGALALVVGCHSGGGVALDGALGPVEGGPRARLDMTVPDLGPAGTGGSGGKPGHTTQEMTHDGNKRVFAVHVPSSYDGTTPVPLLLHFHGWRPPPIGVSSELKYLWGPSADQQTFIAVAPEGQPCPELNPQNPYYCFRQAADGKFVEALIKHLGQLYNLAPDRVFLSGHSGGAFFVQGHGLSSSESYVAVVTFSGGCIAKSDQYGNSCSVYKTLAATAPRKIPFFVVHHAKDKIVPVSYSAELLDLLKSAGHPTSSESDYNPGDTGHSVDPKVVPTVWSWLEGFSLHN